MQFWLDYFKEIHADAACLSAGGCVAYYPTKIPLHYRSRFLGDRDAFGELFEGCRRLGMNVIARTDPHAVHDDVYEAHPDWIMVTADGQPRRHWADPELWVTCALGPYNFEFMTEVTREIVAPVPGGRRLLQPLDGPRHLLLRALPARTSRTPPVTTCPAATTAGAPPARRTSSGGRSASSSCGTCGTRAVREVVPHARFIPNAGGAHGELDMKRIGEKAEILFADRQARRGLMPGLGQRPQRQGVPRHAGAQAHRRHLQRGRGGALSLEGLRAEPGGDPPLRGGWRRQRPAPLVHEVLRR